MLLYGILDIHMFSDGNGRLARIGANWMLKRTLGLPFTIAIAANPQQRREYIEALQKGHAAVKEAQEDHQKKQQSKPSATSVALPNTGIFEPLARLIVDRMANAVRECQRNLDEKSRASMVEEGDRLARQARERLASGACVICLDDNPNIATLCCGQAVHLNCFAEWLANQSTCVYCRRPFQSLQVQRPPPPQQIPAAAVVAPNAGQHNQQQIDETTTLDTTTEENDESETTTHDTPTHETTTDDIEEDETSTGETTAHDNGETETATTSEVDEDETSTGETTAHDNDETETATHETATQGTTTSEVDEDETSTHDTTTEETSIHGTSTDETSVDQSATENATDETTDGTSDDISSAHVQQHSERCGGCNNKAAIDCVNNMCGRCCILNGEYQCHRHGTA